MTKFEEMYPEYSYLIERGRLKELFHNSKASTCRCGNSYIIFPSKYLGYCSIPTDLKYVYDIAMDFDCVFNMVESEVGFSYFNEKLLQEIESAFQRSITTQADPATEKNIALLDQALIKMQTFLDSFEKRGYKA